MFRTGYRGKRYGFDFGDKVLIAFGHALKKEFGLRSAIGRYSGQKFTVLAQVENKNDARMYREKVKAIGDSIREIDGTPVTLYLSVGYALYSEFHDMETLMKNAEVRLLADFDQNFSAESRIDHALELFYLFDDLPVPYAVFRMTHGEPDGPYDAVFFYVNHKFEELAGLPAKKMLGHALREVFPFLTDEWGLHVKSAALDGKTVEGESSNPLNGKQFRFTARQIIYPGYCEVTCAETVRT